MFKRLLSKITIAKTKGKDTSSAFSKFFRQASAGEKKKVYLDVAKEASKEQREVIRSVQHAQ